eukprot:m.27959 g.27959  ORF g.27959 m.27959 type:complete len:760 (+) comp15838_c0_seq1:210-2489(+)
MDNIRRLAGLASSRNGDDSESDDEPRCVHGFREKKIFAIETKSTKGIEGGDEEDTEKENTRVLAISERGKIKQENDGVVIKLVSAAGLPIDIGLGAPVVRVEIPGIKAYTSKGDEVSDSPIWNEEFFLRTDHMPKAKMHIEVYQEKALVLKSMLGSFSQDLKALHLTEVYKAVDITLKRKDKKGKTAGKLKLMVRLGNHRHFAKRSTKNSAPTVDNPGKLVVVNAFTGRFIKPSKPGGLNDTFIKIKSGSQERKTKVVYKDLSPDYNEQLELMVADITYELDVELYQKEFGGRSSLMGSTRIKISELEDDAHVRSWHDIRSVKATSKGADDDEICGQLDLLVVVSDLWKQPARLTPRELRRHSGLLELEVISARRLRIADAWQKSSDPFVVVEVGKKRYRTRTIYKDLSPKWNRVFRIPIDDIFETVVLTVNDEDDGGKQFDFLGRISMRLLQIGNKGGEKWYALKDEDQNKRGQGDLCISAKFTYKTPMCYMTLIKPRVRGITPNKPKFKIATVKKNVSRIVGCVLIVVNGIQFVNNALAGKVNVPVTVISLTCWVMMCLYGRLYHLPLVIIAGLHALKIYQRVNAAMKPSQVAEFEEDSDYDSEEEEESPKNKKKKGKKQSLPAKYKLMKEMAEQVDNKIDQVASLLEKAKNLFFWYKMQISALVVGVLLVATIALYFFHAYLHIAIMVGGVARGLMGMRKLLLGIPKKKKDIADIPLVRLLMRVPDDQQLETYQKFVPITLSKKQMQKYQLRSNPP